MVTTIIILFVALYVLSQALWIGIERRFPPQGRMIETGGTRLHVIERGVERGGIPVVLIHGASGGVAEVLFATASVLADHRVIAFDRPGHGYSDRSDARDVRFPSGQARILIALLDALRIERAILVGHSWGTALAANAAITAPERVAGLVLAAPATHPWFAGGISLYSRLTALPIIGPFFARTLVLPIGLPVLPLAVRAVFSPDPVPPDYISEARIPLILRPTHFRSNALDLVDFRPFLTWQATQYGLIRAPTVILTGDLDPVVRPDIHAHALARQIPGAELWSLPGHGHMIPQVEPDALRRAVERVLERDRESSAAEEGRFP